MQLNVKRLETGGFSEEKRMDFHCELDLSGVRQWGHAPFREPVRVAGEVVGRLGMMTLSYEAAFTREDPCARCLIPVKEERRLRFRHPVAEQLEAADGEEPDDVILAPGGILDLDELVIADMLLDEDTVTLCSPDCLGLCPACGVNRNTQDCSCGDDADESSGKEPDSRFAALLELMKDPDRDPQDSSVE